MKYTKPIIFLLSLIPLAVLVYNAATDNLGSNPIEKIRLFTGDWTLYFLLITLAVTPMRKISGWHELVDRKSTRLNSSHMSESRMPSSA